jgi:hypothetical protein
VADTAAQQLRDSGNGLADNRNRSGLVRAAGQSFEYRQLRGTGFQEQVVIYADYMAQRAVRQCAPLGKGVARESRAEYRGQSRVDGPIAVGLDLNKRIEWMLGQCLEHGRKSVSRRRRAACGHEYAYGSIAVSSPAVTLKRSEPEPRHCVSGVMEAPRMPYGGPELEAFVQRRPSGLVKCVVRGCRQWLVPPTRQSGSGQACPEHGIVIHATTFRYADASDNIVTARDYFREHVLGHRFKFDRSRFGHESSEDAVTWNVFVSLMQASLLKELAALVVAKHIPSEPRLYLWGLSIGGPKVTPWELLVQARERFESDLPVKRPLTEPDAALWLPKHYLILIEAKFTSPNSVFRRDTKTKLFDLTIDQVVEIYRDDELRMLDHRIAGRRALLHHQLWRNATLAQWMARQDSPSTEAYLVNLVREGYEDQTCEEFVTLIKPEYQDRFEQITWEQVYRLVSQHPDQLATLARYLETKTEHLRPAFRIERLKPPL